MIHGPKHWWHVVKSDEEAWYQRVCILALLLAAAGIFLSSYLYAQERERDARDRASSVQHLNERCLADEEAERTAVTSMIRTYEFLDELPKRPTKDPVIEFGVRSLTERYREAEAQIAPDFCDAPGVGLPEPKGGDPKLPDPRDFSYLLPRG